MLGGLTVAVLDGAFAVGRAALRGIPFAHVWQGLAAGLLGARSFDGGLATTLLGLGLHLVIANTVVLVYYLATQRLAILRRHPTPAGGLYGLIVFAVMNFLVIPLSALSLPPRSFAQLLPGMIIHIVGVGLPTAWIVATAWPHPSPDPIA